MDLVKKCRLCLTLTSEFIDIFRENTNDLSIPIVIQRYFGFAVTNDDSISKYLCNECWNQIETFHSYNMRVTQIQNNIKKEEELTNTTIASDGIGTKNELNSVKRLLEQDELDVVLTKKKLKQQKHSDPTFIDSQNKTIRDYIKMECELCSVEIDSFQNLQTHFRSEHNTRGYLRCCDRKFTKRFMLVEHIQQHINPDRFKNS